MKPSITFFHLRDYSNDFDNINNNVNKYDDDEDDDDIDTTNSNINDIIIMIDYNKCNFKLELIFEKKIQLRYKLFSIVENKIDL